MSCHHKTKNAQFPLFTYKPISCDNEAKLEKGEREREIKQQAEAIQY